MPRAHCGLGATYGPAKEGSRAFCPRRDLPRLARADKSLAEDNKTFSKVAHISLMSWHGAPTSGRNIGLRRAILHSG